MHLQVTGRNRPLHGLLPNLVRLRDLRAQFVDLPRDASHIELNFLKCAFFALLQAFPDSKHSRKWESKRHR